MDTNTILQQSLLSEASYADFELAKLSDGSYRGLNGVRLELILQFLLIDCF